MAKGKAKPKCMWCGSKPVVRGSEYFCSEKCAAEWAENVCQEIIDKQWCPQCQEWTDYELEQPCVCEQCKTPYPEQ
jgi:hypothetical protein